MKRAMLWLMTTLICVCASAMNYYGTPFSFSQPDGDCVSVRLFGNDLYIHAESTDGYTLIQDPDDGFICYALVSADSSDYASSGIRYRGGDAPKAVSMIVAPHTRISSKALAQKIEDSKSTLGRQEVDNQPKLRSATVMPDTVYGVTVLIDFPDCRFPYSVSELDKFLNGDNGSINGNAMSIKEYFRWISNGKLTYINYLPKSPYTAPNLKSYYSPSDASTYTFRLLQPVVNDALNSYTKSKDGFDLSDLTVKKSCYYAVNILYAGACPNSWGKGLWPHQSTMTVSIYNDSRVGRSVSQPYQLTYCSENLRMGSFVHESMHLLLDAPDFYPFDDHDDNPAQPFNVADEFIQVSNLNPPIPNPWVLDDAGWLENKIVLNDLKKGTKVELEYGPGNVAVYYGDVDGDPMKERYYFEVRTFYYKSDYSTVKTPGIYIWHVYEPGDNRYEYRKDKLDCRPASSTNPFWTASSPSKVFSDDSNPSAKWDNGDESGLYLCNFSKASTKMSFCYGECDPDTDVEEKIPDADDGAEEDKEDINVGDGGDASKYDMLDLINRDSLPSGRVGEKYYAKLYPVGGDGNYTIKWMDGLPSGLSLNSDFEIVGTPEYAVKKMLKMKVCDGTGAKTEVWLSLKIYGETTSVDDAVADDPAVSVARYNNEFVIVSSQDNINCTVYNIHGVKVDDFKLDNGEIRIFGADYPSGVYIVDANGKRYKLVISLKHETR